jgi:aminoglycoside phosphotransferase (APT) family kinase protein
METYNLEKTIAVRPAKTIYQDNGKVIKLMGEEYPAPDVFAEALNLAAVEETTLKVPRLLEVTRIQGKWAIVWEYAPGTTMADLMSRNQDREQEYLEQFVDIQLEMHAHSATRLPLLSEKLHRKIQASGLDATTRYELQMKLESMPKHKKLCHGDFNPSNIIIDDNGEAAIIDWSHASQGNASADAAQTYLLFRLAGQTDTAEKYLALFCKKSDTARQYVEKWLAIVAASQLPKTREGEKEFLLHWANVVDYE